MTLPAQPSIGSTLPSDSGSPLCRPSQRHRFTLSIPAHQRTFRLNRNIACSIPASSAIYPGFLILSRRSRNQTGKKHPRPCGQILDDPPIHIRPVVPASAGAEGKNPAGSSHYGLPRLAPRIRDHKGFFAESVKSAAIRDYYVTQFAQPAIDAGGRSKGIVAGHEPGCVRVGYATLRWSSACGVVNAAAAPLGR